VSLGPRGRCGWKNSGEAGGRDDRGSGGDWLGAHHRHIGGWSWAEGVPAGGHGGGWRRRPLEAVAPVRGGST
jgi:hypothetical protein